MKLEIRPVVRAFTLAATLGLIAAGGSMAQTRGGTLGLIANPEPPMLNIAMSSLTGSQYIGSKIYQGLLSYGPDLKPRPELAKSWKVSADGLTYTFELQPGVKWHDGKPFTAADAEFSIGKMLPAVHARTRVVLNNYVSSVKAVGPGTLEIKLKSVFPPFIYMFEVGTMPILPKHVFDGSDYASNPANQKPVGTGPFVFKEWKRGAYVKLERNPDYWKKGLPYLDGVTFYIMPDGASRAIAFDKGEVQVLNSSDIEVSEQKRFQKVAGVESTTRGWEFFSPTFHMLVNQRKPPFDNVKVRQAIQHAIDRDFVVNTIFEGSNKPATGPFASTELFYDRKVPQYPFDLAKARALIAESKVNLAQTPVRMMGVPFGGNYERLAEYVKAMLEQIGFQVTYEPTDGATWGSKVASWNFDMTFVMPYQYGDPALGVERLYVSKNITKGSPFANNQGYSNPRADELWAKAGVELDPKKRQAFYSEVQTILAQDVANNWLMDLTIPTLYRSNVKNAVTSGHTVTESLDSAYIQK